MFERFARFAVKTENVSVDLVLEKIACALGLAVLKTDRGAKRLNVLHLKGKRLVLIDEKGEGCIVDVLVNDIALVIVNGGIVKTDKGHAVTAVLDVTAKFGVADGVCEKIVLVGAEYLRRNDLFDGIVV